MSTTFDPYLQWLGIRDPQRPPNYYRLLGVEMFESDPEVLSNAADRQMAHVRTFQTGPHSAESQRILNELAAAKICLLNPQKKAAYDARLREELGLVVPAPPIVIGPTPPAFGGLGRPPVAAPEPPGVAKAEGPGGEVADLSFVHEQTRVRAPVRSFVPAAWLLVAVLTAMAVVLAGLIVFILTTAPGIGVPRLAEGPQEAPRAQPAAASTPAVEAPKPSDVPPAQRAKASAETPAASPKATGAQGKGGPAGKEKPATGKPEAGQARPTPLGPDSLPWPALPSLATDLPAKPAAAPPKPAPSVAEALAAARQALRARDPAKALAQLDLVEKAAKPTEKPEWDRLRLAAGLLEVYWRTVRSRLAELKPGQAITLWGHPATVVQASEERLVVEQNGRSITLAFEALPREVTEPLAEAGLPADVPASLLARAAFELFDATGQAQKAVPWLNKAAAAGQRVELLAQELPPGLAVAGAGKPAGGRFPLPEPAASQAALKKIREVFKEQYAGAQTPADKKALGEALLHQATETNDDPTVRYALLREAQAVAVAAGEGRLLRRVLSQLAKDYEVQESEELARALAEAADAILPAAVRHGLAQTALEVGREALRADSFEYARRLAKTAQLLATKGRDAATARQAGDLAATIPWLKQEFDKAQLAAQRLAEDPNHAQANLVLGIYTALVKEDWNRGLPLLAKGSDSRLRALAEAELALPPAPAPPQMIKLGDQWGAAIKAVDGPLQGAVARRAAFWYGRALPNVSGFTKTYLEQRIARLKELEATRRRP